MTYEASLRNIEYLKSFISPYDVEVIYFNFTSNTEFGIEFIKIVDWDRMEKINHSKYKSGLPYAHIFKKSDNLIKLRYMDTVVDFEFDLTHQHVLEVDFEDALEISRNRARGDLQILIRQLKKTG